jgi:hypothetical protein
MQDGVPIHYDVSPALPEQVGSLAEKRRKKIVLTPVWSGGRNVATRKES